MNGDGVMVHCVDCKQGSIYEAGLALPTLGRLIHCSAPIPASAGYREGTSLYEFCVVLCPCFEAKP